METTILSGCIKDIWYFFPSKACFTRIRYSEGLAAARAFWSGLSSYIAGQKTFELGTQVLMQTRCRSGVGLRLSFVQGFRRIACLDNCESPSNILKLKRPLLPPEQPSNPLYPLLFVPTPR